MSAPKEECFLSDELETDPEINGHKFVGISFLSPEKILKKREIFYFEKFVNTWDFNKSMKKFNDFLHFASDKFNLKIDVLLNDYQEFLKEEEPSLRAESILEDYKSFLDLNEERLAEQFNKENQFQTSVRGLKIRTPTVGTLEEAESLVKKVRERDPTHDIYIGQVGKWMPWDPEAYKTGRVEYLEEKLNELHHAKIKNEELAKMEFDKRVKEAKFKAIKENVELAKRNNNVLTQTIDKDGNLTGVMDTMNLDEREPATAEMKDKNREEMMKKYGGEKKD